MTTKTEFVTEEGIGYDVTEPQSYQSGIATLVNGVKAFFDGHRHLYRIEIAEQNNILGYEEKSRAVIVAGGRVRIWSDDYQIYNFRFTSIMPAIAKLIQVLDSLEKFPVPVRNRKDCEFLISRPVYWREIPAIISDFDGEQGRVRINADNPEQRFIYEPWLEENGNLGCSAQIWEDLLSPRVHWFRNVPE